MELLNEYYEKLKSLKTLYLGLISLVCLGGVFVPIMINPGIVLNNYIFALMMVGSVIGGSAFSAFLSKYIKR